MINFYDNTKAHQELLKKFFVAVSVNFPDAIILSYTNGMFRAFDNPDRIVKAGTKGVLDCFILLKNDWLFFDSKTGKARFTPEQKAFISRCEQVQGRTSAFKLTSVEQGLNVIRERLK